MKKPTLSILISALLLLATTQTVWAAPEASCQSVHIVQWGESLTLIAMRYGVTTASIAQANSLANPNFIYAGQSLVIPAGAAPVPQAGPTTAYTVQRGDTVNAIAARYGTTATQLASANGLWNPNFIYVGQVLQVPGGGPTPDAPPAATCTYSVKSGDILTTIALRYRTTVWALAIANNICCLLAASPASRMCVMKMQLVEASTAGWPLGRP